VCIEDRFIVGLDFIVPRLCCLVEDRVEWWGVCRFCLALYLELVLDLLG
jgi:hypothetical protein